MDLCNSVCGGDMVGTSGKELFVFPLYLLARKNFS